MNENSFYIIGLSYKKADVITRSKFSLSKENQENLLLEAKSNGIEGMMVISTCNRIEIIGFAKHPFKLISLLCKYSKGTVDEFSKVSFVYKNKEAVRHFITIATGLDSQILGDYEIVGQLKDSFQIAKSHGTVNAYIERLYNVALQASKETKNKTSLSSGTTTVSYAAIQYIKDNIKVLKNKNILIYGLGNIGSITAKSCTKYLQDTNITITNRTIEKSINLANAIGAKTIDCHNLPNQIQNADVLIVATGANKPIITSDYFNNNKEQLIIDLSIPKNVDAQVKLLENKTVIDVDILSQKTKNTIESRKKQIPLVEAIIEKYKKEFLEWLGFRKSTPAINNLKHSLENIQKDALHNYFKKHQDSNLDEAEEIATQIVNKIVSKFAIHLKDEQTRTNQSIQVMNEIFV